MQFTLSGTTVSLLPGTFLTYQLGGVKHFLTFTATNDASPPESVQFMFEVNVVGTCVCASIPCHSSCPESPVSHSSRAVTSSRPFIGIDR